MEHNLICASVENARITLDCILNSDPVKARRLAEQALKEIEGKPNQLTRTATLRATIRKADKLIFAASK